MIVAIVDRERIDTVLLVVAFLLGIGSSIMLKASEFPDWLPALTSGGVIIGYVAITLTSARARLDPSQIGDNAYYLGFVLTLASLAYTLYELGSKPEISELFGDVIAGFGIALSSTIVGVIVRVILLQYRVDLVAREREIRLKLNDAMRRFHVEVEDVVRGTKYLGTEIRQSLDEHHQQLAESSGQRIEKLAGELSTGYQQVLDGIVEQSKETNRGLVSSTRNSISGAEKVVLETLNTVSVQLQETNAAMKESVHSAADVLKRNLQETSEMMSEGMSGLRTEVRRSIDEISRAHAEDMTRKAELMDEAATSMQAIGSFARSAQSSISSAEKAVLETLHSVSLQLQETNVTISEGTRSTTEAAKRNLQETSEMMSEGMGDLRTEIRRSAEEISQAHTENMKRTAALMEEASTSMRQAIGFFVERFETSLGDVETTTAKFSDVSGRAHKAMDQLTEDLERLSNQDLEKGSHRPRGVFSFFDRNS